MRLALVTREIGMKDETPVVSRGVSGAVEMGGLCASPHAVHPLLVGVVLQVPNA